MRTDLVRVGDTIRRPAGPWTPSVQALLTHVRARGFVEAAEPLGTDAQGREVASFIEGDSGAAGWDHIVTDAGVDRMGRLLRRYHDATTTFVPAAGARWKLPPLPAEGPDAVICHGDFTPWNLVWRDGTPVGVIDWELARPGHRLDDLAWTAVWVAPLRSDEEAVTGWGCWDVPPDRRHRLGRLVDAYAAGSPTEIVDRAVTVLRRTYVDVVSLADQGFEPQRTWVATGAATADLDRADWIDGHRHLLT